MVTLAKFNTICFVRIVRLFPACLAICLAVPSAALSAPREIRIPPVGETIKVDVMRGGSAVITMKAFEGRGNPLAYEFASRPRHGRLEDFQQADEDRQGFASVVYVHGDDEDSQEDEFTFKARALIGGGVSSPVAVKIRIRDRSPQLSVTPEADFRAVGGESDVQQVILANEGGGVIEGRVVLQEPFLVEGNDRFALRRGEMTNIFIRFSPRTTEAVPSQKISPAPEYPGATITLRGEAMSPFSASAEPLQLQPDGSRAGMLRITNLSAAKTSVEIATAPAETVDVPTRADLPESGCLEIPIVIAAEKAGGALDLVFTVSNPVHRQDLQVAAPGVPASLELETPELDFRMRNEAELVVRNKGGAEGRFSIDLPAEVESLEKAASFVVPAGKEKRVGLRREERNEGDSGKEMTVDLGKAGKVPVAMLVTPRAPTPTPEAEPRTRADSESSQDSSNNSPAKVETHGQPASMRKIEKVEVNVRGTQADVNVTIEADPEISNFRIERGVIEAEKDARTGKIKGAGFVAVDHAGKARIADSSTTTRDGRKLTTVTASVDGLPKGAATLWRLVPLAGQRPLTPTKEFLIATAPPWQIPTRVLFIASMLLLLCCVLWLRHKRERPSEG